MSLNLVKFSVLYNYSKGADSIFETKFPVIILKRPTNQLLVLRFFYIGQIRNYPKGFDILTVSF